MSIKSCFHFNVLAARETVTFHDRLISKLLRFPNLAICVVQPSGCPWAKGEGRLKKGKSIRTGVSDQLSYRLKQWSCS